jgi:hypothetical protein
MMLLALTAPLYVACKANKADRAETASDLLRLPVSSQREKPFADFNRTAAEAASRGEDWPQDPVLFARRFSGRHSERIGAWSMEGTGERPSRYRLVVISDGFLDDSVRGERLEMLLVRSAGEYWQVGEARSSVRCWEDRGHQDFSGEPCQ